MLRLRERLEINEQDDQIRDKRLKEAVNKKPQTKQQQWVNLFKNNNSSKLKKHILKFFLSQGHMDIAKQFAQQANIEPKQTPKINEQAITQRYEVVKLIKQGQIDEALQKINKLSNAQIFECQMFKGQVSEGQILKGQVPEGQMLEQSTKATDKVPQSNIEILFCLKSLKVINLIKQKNLQNAIIKARKELLPFTRHDMKYLPRIQEIMSLLVFSDMKNCSNYYLTTGQYRTKIAKQVNRLLLSSQSEALQYSKQNSVNISYDSISEMLKLTKWLEKRLQNYILFPNVNLKNSESDKMFL